MPTLAPLAVRPLESQNCGISFAHSISRPSTVPDLQMPKPSTARHLQLESPLRGEPLQRRTSVASRRAARRPARRQHGAGRIAGWSNQFEDNSQFIAASYIGRLSSRCAVTRRWHPMRSGSSTTITSWRNSSGRSAKTCRASFTRAAEARPAPFCGISPRLRTGIELVVHTDSSLDEELIAGFITSYQQRRRSPAASCGRCRSCCGWPWWRICVVCVVTSW